ncbi:hypothetical protein [Bacillus suaedaesalsae]|uniref:Uncharacterized protein n=1 Tax=Bacillus suaedaesalsae TaxID=2810349 RepID=A0ABS2DGI6_9BACI|nr:hypothetical protein [Bacillus suaedaesalsae]MBM6617597.1 hypothetical protein [Bacillus suaedaesalsae]
MQKDDKKVKLSYESDGKMGKENNHDSKHANQKNENEFFNITQGSE